MGLIELLGAALAAIVGAFFYGKKKARADQRAKEALSYKKGMENINEAISDVPESVDAARGWLRKRGQR